jgi:hypothetical protein
MSCCAPASEAPWCRRNLWKSKYWPSTLMMAAGTSIDGDGHRRPWLKIVDGKRIVESQPQPYTCGYTNV